MTAAAPATGTQLGEQQLGLLFQYTVEAYKTFEKLAENLPNPMAATMFQQFAVDERDTRDLLEMKIAASGARGPLRVTLGADLLFQDILEGDLSYRETTEFLIARERTMERKLTELSRGVPIADRPLMIYIASGKRAHIVNLERELELIKIDPDWFKREDAQTRIVHGPRNE
jgi:rubrerythrin